MSTVIELAEAGALIRFDASLSSRQQPLRRIYLLPRVVEWIEKKLPTLMADWALEVTPLEQLDDFAAIFVAGDAIQYERQAKPLRHVEAGVWELKTADLRMFGWFTDRDCFVCSAIDLATRVKRTRMYAGYRDQAVHDRKQLDLDHPKFIESDNPDAVVSNLTYP